MPLRLRLIVLSVLLIVSQLASVALYLSHDIDHDHSTSECLVCVIANDTEDDPAGYLPPAQIWLGIQFPVSKIAEQSLGIHLVFATAVNARAPPLGL
ncbi:MAG: hypothetical protein AAGK23_01900 [Pseudomonadota bacterium]